jgi:hypothetical protein
MEPQLAWSSDCLERAPNLSDAYNHHEREISVRLPSIQRAHQVTTIVVSAMVLLLATAV